MTDRVTPGRRDSRPAFLAYLTVPFFASACAAALLFGVSAAQAQHAPNLSGVWAREAHNYPKPYMAGRAGIKDGYNNEYLKPWVVELLNRDDLVTASGRPIVTAHSVCYPEGVPYVFGGTQIQILQKPTEITMLFGDANQFRTIYLNRAHPAHVKPSWYGDSVGHFEGDTLVVDTVGIGVHPEAGSMGFFGTPHTDALHLVERYRFLRPGEKSMAPPPKNDSFDADAVIAEGPILRLSFTLEDPGAYKKPWSVTLDYLPLSSHLREYVCAENSRDKDLGPLLPRAEVPDF
jgi:hypothetical protein